MAEKPKTISLNLSAEEVPDTFTPDRLTVSLVTVEEDEVPVKYVDAVIRGTCTLAGVGAGDRDATVRVTEASVLGQTLVKALNLVLAEAAKQEELAGIVG